MTTIVMTGGTSGIGRVAAAQLAAIPGTELMLGARSASRDGLEVLPLDLARLASVRSFAERVVELLGDRSIDALVLNAGVSFHRGDMRTTDGFETTFAVNHLAHFLLLRVLLPHMADGGRVIITTSSTHDPEHAGLLPPPRTADARLLAHPERDPERDADPRTAGGRAYASSKLCNILTALSLAEDGEARRRNLRVVAFDPGPTPGTGLSREFRPAIRLVWAILGSPAGRLVPRLSSRRLAGSTLAGLALGRIRNEHGRTYASLRRGELTWPEPSVLARDPVVRDALWRDSATLVGLPAERSQPNR